ncbi:unnamed protein product [Trichobilharzia regenti]|nr:unnamed protein product [Trichobilharzia regenti]
MLLTLLDRIGSYTSYQSSSPAGSTKAVKSSNHQHRVSTSKVPSIGEYGRSSPLNSRHRLFGSQNLEMRPKQSSNLQRSDGSNGSMELDRSTENVMNTSNLVVSNRNKGQSNDIQNQFDQFQNEVRQQLRDIRRECDSLKETHLQLRNDWIKGQKNLAERFQTLMDELDEIKKLRANDAVELTRFRTILMRLDANYLINSSNHITLDNTGAEEKLYDSANFLGISNASISQRNVNFKTVSKDEVEEEEDRRNDHNDSISPTDKHSLTTTQMSSQKSSIKPSLRPRPAPAYGIVSTSRR